LREKPPQLLAEPVGEATALLPEVVVDAGQLPQWQQPGILGIQPPERRPVRAQRRGQHEGIAPIILGARHAVAIAEAIELLGIEREDVDAAFQQRVHQGPARHF
jgi:hypothetical protein